MLIATPIVLNVINDSRKVAFEESARNIVRAAELEYWNNTLNGPPKGLKFKYENGDAISTVLEFKGKNPESGTIHVNKDGEVAMAIHDGTWCATKEFDNKVISLEKKSQEDCYVDEVVEYTDASCFEYEEITTVQSFDINYSACMLYFTDMFENESIAEELCSGRSVEGMTLQDVINGGFVSLDELIQDGAIYNLMGIKDGIAITDYFNRCPRDVSIPKMIDNKDVISIASYSFAEYEITSVIIPSSVIKIEESAFRYNNINKINIKNGVKYIGPYAFDDNQLTEVVIPKSVTAIKERAFSHNHLTQGNVIIDNCPINVTLDKNSFEDNYDYFILPVYLGENCEDLPPEVCFEFNEEDRTIYGYNWHSCPMNVVIPDTMNGVPVEHIGEGAFDFPGGVGKLQLTSADDYYVESQPAGILSVQLPSYLKTIGEYAFSRNRLTEVIIPNGVTSIGDYAFGDNHLTSVTIPSSVKYLDGFDYNQLASVMIPNGVEYLSGFSGNQLTEIVIPSSVKTIGEFAFTENQLTEVVIPNSVTTIEPYAFYINQLTSLVIPNSVTFIGDYAFTYNQLININIPNGVTTIGSRVFSENQLTKITIPNGVTQIQYQAFYRNKLTEILLPNSVRIIGIYAFEYNRITQGNAKIDNSTGNVNIGSGAFNNNGPSGNQTITPTYLR